MASTLGVRSLREDYAKPTNRSQLIQNLKVIEERLSSIETMASVERLEVPRFQHLFQGGELIPAGLFMMALLMKDSEMINGRVMPFDPEVLMLRDQMVMAYKPVTAKIRLVQSRELAEIPLKLVQSFARAWTAWESAWLRNREVHAVDALQPLAKAILALVPLINSSEKERLLPWPRVQHQKVVTMKCLEGFIECLSELSASILPSLKRELDHDPRLLLLMDHVLSLRGDKPVARCLDGISAAPEVVFPDYKSKKASNLLLTEPISKHMSLDTYAFNLLGTSIGDAAASGKMNHESGNGQAGRAKLTVSLGVDETSIARLVEMNAKAAQPFVPKLSDLAEKARNHALELLAAFEAVKDQLLSCKASLEHIDAALDQDEVFVRLLMRFERAYKKAKKLFLEPDNLA